MPTIEFTAISADELSDIDEAAVLVLQIPREQIEQQNISTTLEKLLVLSDNRQQALLRKESLMISVSGYDSDRREIFEIPAVRAFFKRLTAEWPYWLWFLSRKTGTVALFMTLLCQVKIHRSRRGSFGTEFLEPEELAATMMDLFHRANPLFDALQIPEELLEASSLSLTKELTGE